MLALVDWPKEAAKAQELIAKAAAEMAAAAADAAAAGEEEEEEEGTPGDAETGDAVPALEAAPRVASAFAAGVHLFRQPCCMEAWHALLAVLHAAGSSTGYPPSPGTR